MPPSQHFMKAATEMIVNDGKFTFEQNRLLPNKLAYESYDIANLTRIANEEWSSLLSEKTSREIFRGLNINDGRQEELEEIIREQNEKASKSKTLAISLNDFIVAIEEEKKNPNYDKERTEKLRDQWIKASKKAGTWTQENEDKIMAIQLSAKSVPAFMPTPWK